MNQLEPKGAWGSTGTDRLVEGKEATGGRVGGEEDCETVAVEYTREIP